MLYIAQQRRKVLDGPLRALAESVDPAARVSQLTYAFTELCERSRSGATLPTAPLDDEQQERLRTKINSVARSISKTKRSGELGYAFTNLLIQTLPADEGRYHAQNTGIIGMTLQQIAPGTLDAAVESQRVDAQGEEAGALMTTLLQYQQRVLKPEEDWKRYMSGDLDVFKKLEKKTLYLSHPTKERFKVKEEIQPRIEELGIRVINPFMLGGREHILYNKDLLGKMPELIEEEAKHTDPDDMVIMELGAIRKADGVFAYVPYQTMGTLVEIWFNSNQLKRGKHSTFVLLDPERNDDYFAQHPWLTTITSPAREFAELEERLLRWASENNHQGESLSDAEQFIRMSSLLEDRLRTG